MSVSSLWNKVKNFVHGAAVKVDAAFVRIFGQQAADQFAAGALSLLKTAEGKIVLDAVEAVQALAGSGAEKRNAAFLQIVSDFKTQGISVGESVINMLIEVAVAYLKGTIAAA